MRNYIIAISLALSTSAFADDVEVNGQFVVAPVATDDCQAVALTQPTQGITADNELLDMLTYFMNNSNESTAIHEVTQADEVQGTQPAIYSLDGKKRNKLQRGINIVVDQQGHTKKIVVR